MSGEEKSGQGVGARVPRKEDSRHLHGRGTFVPDMILPGQREVAFFRSPVAHARITAVRKPAGSEGRIFVREDMPEVKAIVAPSTLPTFKLSEQHHLAWGKVRFVGEPIACCVGRTRAEAEDLAEQVEVDFEELPVLVDAPRPSGSFHPNS
jgi:carbon-monoxide dehydrogenase large subunit